MIEFYLQTTEEERKATQESYTQANVYLTWFSSVQLPSHV